MQWQTRWYGLTDYDHSLKEMSQHSQHVRSSGIGLIMGMEYPTVVTLGIRGSQSDVKFESTFPVKKIDRGGQATLHNPGQLVIYPIIPIKQWGFTVREWVHLLTKTTENSLRLCNIIIVDAKLGLFTQKGKIASIGINIKAGISTHGIAINISNLLSDFSQIIACGVHNQPFDKVEHYISMTPEDFFSIWLREFARSLETYRDDTLTTKPLSP